MLSILELEHMVSSASMVAYALNTPIVHLHIVIFSQSSFETFIVIVGPYLCYPASMILPYFYIHNLPAKACLVYRDRTHN